MLKKVTILYRVAYAAEITLNQEDGESDSDFIDRAAQEIDIPEGGDHDSVYVEGSFHLKEGEISND